jgi:quinol monooxygenase YgiN
VIVFRVSGRARAEKVDQARAMFAALSVASRDVPGVISFHVAQDVTDPAVFVSAEVYENEDALARQADLSELQALMAVLDDLFAEGPEGTLFHVSASEPWPH